jgi:hypothetical protein
MAEPENTIVPLLREMRAEINARFDETDRGLEGIIVRLDRLIEGMQSLTFQLHDRIACKQAFLKRLAR